MLCYPWNIFGSWVIFLIFEVLAAGIWGNERIQRDDFEKKNDDFNHTMTVNH